jgi:hypothetical protein
MMALTTRGMTLFRLLDGDITPSREMDCCSIAHYGRRPATGSLIEHPHGRGTQSRTPSGR